MAQYLISSMIELKGEGTLSQDRYFHLLLHAIKHKINVVATNGSLECLAPDQNYLIGRMNTTF